MKKSFFLIFALLFTGCQISEQVAQKRIVKYVKLYPNLQDTTKTRIYSVLTLPGKTDSVRITLPTDTVAFDSLLNKYVVSATQITQLQNLILTLKGDLKHPNEEQSRALHQAQRQLAQLTRQLRKGSFQDTTVAVSDSLLDLHLRWNNGVPIITYTIKPREARYVTEVRQAGIKVCVEKQVWQFWQFWVSVISNVIVGLYITRATFKHS